jgi:hypothetical protein
MATMLRFLALAATASAISIAEINGPRFLSPFNGQTVTSEAVYIFGRTFGANLTVGDSIVIGGRVTEFRTNRDYLYLTEIDRPTLTRKISSGNKVEPLVIGKDTRDPPTEQYSILDGGDVFAVPNNKTLVSVANPALEPSKYGLDFWESLSGELVTVQKPIALTKPNNFGDTWIAGNWKLTGKNDRDGLTITDKDANPEAIIIGSPLDGTKNPAGTKMGDEVEEITGVVSYAFGFYRILPRTAIKVTKSQKPTLPKPTKLESKGRCEGITIGAYNVENITRCWRAILSTTCDHQISSSSRRYRTTMVLQTTQVSQLLT